jgi:hypothetical protein
MYHAYHEEWGAEGGAASAPREREVVPVAAV